MKTLKELKQAAENKGLRHEVNKWDPTIHRWETDKEPNPDFMKIEIGIEYRPNIWAWFDGYVEKDVSDDDLTLFFRETHTVYAVDKTNPSEEVGKLSVNYLVKHKPEGASALSLNKFV